MLGRKERGTIKTPLALLGSLLTGIMDLSTDYQEEDTMATLTNEDLSHEELGMLLDALEDKKTSEQVNLDMNDEAFLDERTPEEVKDNIEKLTALIHKVDMLHLK